MTRTLISKTMRIGRAVVLAVGLAVGLAVVLDMTLGIATTALAAVPGDPFRLGQINPANAVSRLVGEVDGPMLVVDNDSSGPRTRRDHLQSLYSLREAGSQPPSYGCDRGVDHLVGIMNRHTYPG